MLIVLDNVLTQEEMLSVRERFTLDPTLRFVRWIECAYSDVEKYPSPISKLLSIANKYFNVESMRGAEMWAHLGTRPDWHVDKDEVLFETSGELFCPICSIVYYAEVSELTGGAFKTESVEVRPLENRMLIFAPGILHGVEEYTGTRLSVALNPWVAKPMERK